MGIKRVAIINRYYPPNPSITGESAWELAKYIADHHSNIEIQVICTPFKYTGGTSKHVPVGKVHTVASIYNGKNKILRLLGNSVEGFLMAIKAVSLNCSCIICLTDPPLVNFWVALVAGIWRKKWIFWSMDLYPEAFISSGLAKRKNPFYKLFHKVTVQFPPSFIISLGAMQLNFILNKLKKNIPAVILPCGIVENGAESAVPPWKKDKEKIYIAYAGNIGEAHHAEFVETFIASYPKNKVKLVLSLYGGKSEKLKKQASTDPQIIWLDFLTFHDLSHIDIHMVSLLPQWTHVCVPSKAVTAVCAGGSLLFNGSRESDTWNMFAPSGWMIAGNNGSLSGELDHFFETLDTQNIHEKRNHSLLLHHQLINQKLEAFDQICEFIQNK